MLVFALLNEVCCICIPVLSRSTIEILVGFITAFSPNSSAPINSILVGIFFTVLVLLEDCTITSSRAFSSSFKKKINASFEGTVMLFSIVSKPK